MKQIAVIVGCIFFVGSAFAQKNAKHETKPSLSPYFVRAEAGKNGVWGTIKDAQGEPLADVEVMVYKLDTIIASGFSNEDGHFTTNPCREGKYTLKLVYNNGKYITVSGVEIKKGRIMLDLKVNAPTADSTVSWAELQPKKKNEKGKK